MIRKRRVWIEVKTRKSRMNPSVIFFSRRRGSEALLPRATTSRRPRTRWRILGHTETSLNVKMAAVHTRAPSSESYLLSTKIRVPTQCLIR